MNKIFQIAVLIILTLSIAGNAVLGFVLSNEIQNGNALKNKLNEVNVQLSDTRSALLKTQADLETTKESLDKKTDALSALSKKYTEVSTKLNRVMCKDIISAETVKSVSTNQALIDPITKVSEKYYSDNSVNTTFELLWNNTKTAEFTITWPDQLTSKVLVSWGFDTSRIEAIVNAGDGCLFYIR